PDGGHHSPRGAHLTGARFALHAPEIRTGGQVHLTDLRASGTVKLDGARTGGNLGCDGACVGGNLGCDGACVGGNLGCDGARLTSSTDAALVAADLQVDDNLLLSNGFHTTTGSTAVAAVRIRGVRIRGARVGGQLVLRDAKATGTVALDLEQVRVGVKILFAPDFPDGLVDLT
ncbi:hypothetical protein, partial [Umezawaea sp.]|uniref:hypothetical protein n=1 Tax=Umezawaea sp. TaxID=1955258 RepID=UPI002EFC80C0